MPQKRINYFDWMRAAGAVAIVLLHVVRAFELSSSVMATADVSQLIHAESIVVAPLARWAVPCFFMMSGALFLDQMRRYTWKKMFFHIARLGVVLLTFGWLFALMERVYNAGLFDASQLLASLTDVLTGKTWDHLWFVYVLMALYLVVIPLRWLLRKLSLGGQGLLAFILWIFCCVIPTHFYYVLQSLSAPAAQSAGETSEAVLATASWVITAGSGTSIFVALCSACFGLVYFVAGHVLYEWLCQRQKSFRLQRALGVLACVLTIAYVLEIYGYDRMLLPEFVFALPLGIAVFCTFAGIPWPPLQEHKLVAALSLESFAIYIVHPLFTHVLLLLGPFVGIAAAAGAGGIFIFEVICFFVSIFGSLLIAKVLKRIIPAARRIL